MPADGSMGGTATTFKFLHAADIHLDSPLRGLARYEGVPAEDVRLATRTALNNLVDAAIEEEVAFIIIAGDLYDGEWPHFGTGLFFCPPWAGWREPAFLFSCCMATTTLSRC